MFSLKRKQKGFTIVELLIVIVVIGILATLVIVTFAGIQKKARDSQRQTDIQAVNAQLEAFYTQYGFYPNVLDLNTASFRTAYLKGLDPEALKDPKGGALTSGTGSSSAYGYNVTASSTSTGTCPATATVITGGVPVDNGCDTYVLTANLEGSTTPYVKQSN
jgi:prepilin-type N-terminal cleavage/methylation domain-containing protein